jgi:hypothetical protein
MIKLTSLLNEIINEALPISKAKELYSIQKSDKVIQYQNKIFNELKNTSEYIKSNKTGDRLYFTFIGKKDKEYEENEVGEFSSEVFKMLQNNGYEIKDYVKGIAIDKYDREVKIGKVLNKLNPELLQKFNFDEKRKAYKKENQIIVISKSPYDIGGMSTDRGWKSCMNIYTGKEAAYINCDIEYGTIIAYLTSTHDLNIEHPQARILIKPFINTKNSDDIVYVPGNRIYGTAPESFKKFINKIFEQFHPKEGIYNLTPNLYPDEEQHDVDFKSNQNVIKDKKVEKKIIKNIPLSKDELNVDNLILVDKNIKSLPDGLNITNLLSLAYNPDLKRLPDNIKIGGNLWLNITGIEDLPKNLKIKGDINLASTPLAKKYKNDEKLIRKAYPNILGQIYVY